MKGLVISKIVSESVSEANRGGGSKQIRLVIPGLDHLTILKYHDQLLAVQSEVPDPEQVLGEVEVPDDLVQTAQKFVEAKIRLNGMQDVFLAMTSTAPRIMDIEEGLEIIPNVRCRFVDLYSQEFDKRFETAALYKHKTNGLVVKAIQVDENIAFNYCGGETGLRFGGYLLERQYDMVRLPMHSTYFENSFERVKHQV